MTRPSTQRYPGSQPYPVSHVGHAGTPCLKTVPTPGVVTAYGEPTDASLKEVVEATNGEPQEGKREEQTQDEEETLGDGVMTHGEDGSTLLAQGQ